MTAPKNNIQEGKPKVSLLPMDILIKYLVPAYEEGITKYGRESWRDGFHTSIMIDAALRHIGEFFWNKCDIDSDSSTNKHHLAGAIFSLLCILQSLDKHPDLDDRFTYRKAKKSEMHKLAPSQISLKFECGDCNNDISTDVQDIMDMGIPICSICEQDMVFTEVE